MTTFDAFLARACPGLDLEWRKYRRCEARRAVNERLRELGLPDYQAYLGLLRRDPGEAAGLADRMRITVTRFFRERERWQIPAERILPELVAAAPPRRTVRAWSAGCCGGEEPYALAIVWLERIAPVAPDATLEILATDIDEPSLARAREGVSRAERAARGAARRARALVQARGAALPRRRCGAPDGALREAQPGDQPGAERDRPRPLPLPRVHLLHRHASAAGRAAPVERAAPGRGADDRAKGGTRTGPARALRALAARARLLPPARPGVSGCGSAPVAPGGCRAGPRPAACPRRPARSPAASGAPPRSTRRPRGRPRRAGR